jgi:hypothetical protein
MQSDALRYSARWPSAKWSGSFSSATRHLLLSAQARRGNVPGYYHSSRLRRTRFSGGHTSFLKFENLCTLAQSPCACGRVLDRASQRIGQRAAILPDHRGAGCVARHYFDGTRFMARHRTQDFQVMCRHLRALCAAPNLPGLPRPG